MENILYSKFDQIFQCLVSKNQEVDMGFFSLQ
jgi:hypothetical protein